MSVNSCLHRNFIPDLEGFKAIMAGYLNKWKGAYTLEERLMVESEMVEMFKEVIEFSYEMEALTARDHPDATDLNKERDTTAKTLSVTSSKLRSIAQHYLDYFNSQQKALIQLIGLLKRGKQTISTLRLWDKTKSKWVVSESFLNMDSLDSNYISTPVCSIDTSGGFATLPISGSKNIKPKRVAISSGSNGIPGNSEVNEINTSNMVPDLCFDDNPDTWFEYERLDSGPLTLSLTCRLPKAEIINGFAIEALNQGEGMDFTIEDISFNLVSNKTKSIFDLVSPALPDAYMNIKTIGNDTHWVISHMPVRCKSITIKFRQENSYYIKTRTQDKRIVQRKRFALGIKAIELKQITYKPKGGINSIAHGIPEGIYAATATGLLFPRTPTLFSANLNVSLDGGENWENDTLGIPAEEGDSLLCDGEAFQAIWALELTRNDDVFSSATSFTDEEPKIETNSALKNVSPKNSPARIQLKEKPYNKEVFVIQPKVGIKTNKSKNAIPLGVVGTPAKTKIDLPFSAIDAGLNISQMHIYARGTELTRSFDNLALTESEYYLSEDTASLEFENIEPGSVIAYSFDLESLLFEERADGFYAEFESLFDPDKDNIVLTSLPSSPAKASLLLTPGKRTIPLGHKYISNYKIVSEEGNVYVEFGNHLDLNAFAGTGYMIDTINGVVYLSEHIESDNVKLSYSHSTPRLLNSSDFSIWYEGIKPVGVIVNPSAIIVKEVTEFPFNTGAESSQKRINPKTGEYNFRKNLFIGAGVKTRHTLSHDYIVRGSVVLGPEVFGRESSYPNPTEVAFYDGHSEFLGLITMENEYTVEIETSPGLDYVLFRLAAGGSWYRKFGIEFSDTDYFFQSVPNVGDVSSPGDYFISDDGVVKVHVGIGGKLPEDIKISYSYSDPTFDKTNRFSIDYSSGNIFLSEDYVHPN
jgi:hypothetical protein